MCLVGLGVAAKADLSVSSCFALMVVLGPLLFVAPCRASSCFAFSLSRSLSGFSENLGFEFSSLQFESKLQLLWLLLMTHSYWSSPSPSPPPPPPAAADRLKVEPLLRSTHATDAGNNVASFITCDGSATESRDSSPLTLVPSSFSSSSSSSSSLSSLSSTSSSLPRSLS